MKPVLPSLVLVLVIDPRTGFGTGLAKTIEVHHHPSQHRGDPIQQIVYGRRIARSSGLFSITITSTVAPRLSTSTKGVALPGRPSPSGRRWYEPRVVRQAVVT